MRLIFTCMVGMVIGLSSFSIKNNPDTPVRTLDATRWYLTTIYRDNGYTQLLSGNAFLTIHTDKGNAGGNGSCNSFGATVTVDGESIQFKNLFSTKMFCEEFQSIEKDYMERLKRVTRFEIKKNKLLLYEGDKLLLEFIGV